MRIDLGGQPVRRVLVVDDDKLQLNGIAGDLQSVLEGYQVVKARDAEEAVAAIETQGPFDVVVTDMMMKQEPSGLRVIKAASNADDNTEVIVYTHFGQLENVYLSIEAGATQYIDKNMSGADEVLKQVVAVRARRVAKTRDDMKRLAGDPDMQVLFLKAQVNELQRAIKFFGAGDPKDKIKRQIEGLLNVLSAVTERIGAIEQSVGDLSTTASEVQRIAELLNSVFDEEAVQS